MKPDSSILKSDTPITLMEKERKNNRTKPPLDAVSVRVRFITLMQRYSGERDLRMDLPRDPKSAIATIITHFEIPWEERLEKRTRIFINKQFAETYMKSGKKLEKDDLIAFIPISGGG